MMSIHDVFRRLSARFSGSSAHEIDEELRDHIARQTELNIAAGIDSTEAHRHAIIAFGGVEKAREECHELRPVATFETLA